MPILFSVDQLLGDPLQHISPVGAKLYNLFVSACELLRFCTCYEERKVLHYFLCWILIIIVMIMQTAWLHVCICICEGSKWETLESWSTVTVSHHKEDSDSQLWQSVESQHKKINHPNSGGGFPNNLGFCEWNSRAQWKGRFVCILNSSVLDIQNDRMQMCCRGDCGPWINGNNFGYKRYSVRNGSYLNFLYWLFSGLIPS